MFNTADLDTCVTLKIGLASVTGVHITVVLEERMFDSYSTEFL